MADVPLTTAEQLWGRFQSGEISGREIIAWATMTSQSGGVLAGHPALIDIACLAASLQDDVERAPALLQELVRQTVDFDVTPDALRESKADADATLADPLSQPIAAGAAPSVVLGLCPGVAPHWAAQRRATLSLDPGLYALASAMIRLTVTAIEADDAAALADLARATETLLHRGDEAVVAAMTIGFLEGISNTCGHDPQRLPFQRLVRHLGPRALEQSRAIDTFWGTRMTDGATAG